MDTSQNQNLSVVRRFIDGAVNGRDLSVIDETWSDDLRWSGGSLGTYVGKQALKRFMAESATDAWESMHLAIHDVIAAHDKIVLRFTNSGTNVGPFMGNPATGKRAEWLGIGIYTLRDQRITEGSFAEDVLGMLTQLGTLPG
jgi:predicted ester cyclase